jgi:hypothetical protein
MSESHQARRYREALPNVGRRCYWTDDSSDRWGTIVDVIKVRGGSRYVVEWDEGTPLWFGTEVSTAHGPSFVIEAHQEAS